MKKYTDAWWLMLQVKYTAIALILLLIGSTASSYLVEILMRPEAGTFSFFIGIVYSASIFYLMKRCDKEAS